jgi:alpha-tubulin suppressor-like RCC1 family protein
MKRLDRCRLLTIPVLVAMPVLAACDILDTVRDGLLIESPEGTLVIGDTMRMSIERLDGSTPSPSWVRWASSDETIATVDETGLVTGTGVGQVEISASAQGLTATLFLWVWELAPPFVSVEVGLGHSCGLTEDGRAWCWGANWDSQLGVPSVPDQCLPSAPLPCATGALPVLTDTRFETLALGGNHSCGLTSSGIAWCWGANGSGQLGDGETTNRWSPEPVSGDHVFRWLAAGQAGTCGITAHDELLCWGSSPSLDLESDHPAATPVRTATEPRFTSMATAAGHSCALTAEGATWCWGRNDHGQLGVANGGTTTQPQHVAAAPPLISLALAGDYTCGLAGDGTAYCWGRNHVGQLGDGTTEDHWEVRAVLGERSFSRLAAGPSHACALDPAGHLFCWGQDRTDFGRGGDPVQATEPLPAAPGLAFTAIAVGAGHTCGVADTGTTWCWGSNMFGTLGSGRSNPQPVATPVRVVRRSDIP